MNSTLKTSWFECSWRACNLKEGHFSVISSQISLFTSLSGHVTKTSKHYQYIDCSESFLKSIDLSFQQYPTIGLLLSLLKVTAIILNKCYFSCRHKNVLTEKNKSRAWSGVSVLFVLVDRLSSFLSSIFLFLITGNIIIEVI